MKLRLVPLRQHVSLGLCEQVANVLFALPHVLGEHFRPVDDLRLLIDKHLANLPRNQRLTASRCSVQQHTSHVHQAHLSKHRCGVYARRKGAPKDVGDLKVEATNTHLAEREIRAEHLGRSRALQHIGQIHGASRSLCDDTECVRSHNADGGGGGVALFERLEGLGGGGGGAFDDFELHYAACQVVALEVCEEILGDGEDVFVEVGCNVIAHLLGVDGVLALGGLVGKVNFDDNLADVNIVGGSSPRLNSQ
mmetsp:Transcript_17368/g.34035  ORF Transcript_17368/g.34035 Transcript_17368/m.34035 type:complete len:251 (-) Transcript_17368:430-1182(-)